MPARFRLLGVPTSAGAHGPGQEKAPAALRQAGILDAFDSAAVSLDDAGDLPLVRFQPDPANRKAQSADRVAEVARLVADRVDAVVREGAVPVVIGGDCTITLGVVSGLLRSAPDDLGLLYVDGDVDLHTPLTTRSGILDNMGVAHLIGAAETPLRDLGPRQPLLSDEQIVLFGYDPAEQEAVQLQTLSGRTIPSYPSAAVSADPVGAAEQAVARLARNHSRVLVHFDVDVIDTTELPLADFPHFNAGLSMLTAFTCLHMFLQSRAVAGIVVTEINPDHDPEGVILPTFINWFADAFGS